LKENVIIVNIKIKLERRDYYVVIIITNLTRVQVKNTTLVDPNVNGLESLLKRKKQNLLKSKKKNQLRLKKKNQLNKKRKLFTNYVSMNLIRKI